MLAKLEKFRTIEAIDRSRGQRGETMAAACNDNHRVCFSAPTGRRLHRPVLGCRWIKGRAGALECIWHVEPAEEPAADEPLRSWLVGQAMPLAAA